VGSFKQHSLFYERIKKKKKITLEILVEIVFSYGGDGI
jgi:hypothetical protein